MGGDRFRSNSADAGLSQQNYCRVMEVIGGHCAATGGVRQLAHHSIGLRALQLFGSDEQKRNLDEAPGELVKKYRRLRPHRNPEAGSDMPPNVANAGNAHAGRQRLRAQRGKAVHHETAPSLRC